MEDPKSGAVRLSEEGESMYIVITAAADGASAAHWAEEYLLKRV